MLARYGTIGTPTTPEAHVNTFIGIGEKPASTSMPNTAHGDSIIFSWITAMPASMPCSMPSEANSGLTTANA